jgi:amidohydrolase
VIFALGLLAAAAAQTPDAEIQAAAQALRPRLVELRRDFHTHPELSNREERTGRIVAERLRSLGLEVRHPVARTGVVGVLRGGRPGGVVALRADMDALPIEEQNDVPYRSQSPGVMHACGHDGHTAIGLGVAEVLAGLKARLPGTVVFLFQPAEEGPPEGEEGGAPLMIQEGVLERPKVEAVFGLHLGVGVETGTVGWTPGALLASSDRFVIEVEGQRSHGATPHKGLDPIPVAAEIVQALQLVVSRQLDAQNPKVLTIGSIHGGNRFNILADKVTLEGTLRSLDPAVRRELKERMARTIAGVAAAHGTHASLRFVGAGNAATINDATLARAVRPSLERVFGKDKVLDAPPQMVAEDFSAFAERVPAVYLLIGGRNEAKGITAVNHSDRFDIDEDVLPLSVRAMATVIWDQLGRSPR